MSERKNVRVSTVCLLVGLLAVLFFAACSSKAVNAADEIELGQKYLSEMNYTEAIASFTEAIRLDPENIQAYMGRAEAYLALGEYEKALEDYQFVSGKTEEMPYTRALSYAGQAEVYEKTDEPDRALSSYRLAKVLLTASDVGKAESITEDDVKVKLVEVLYAHAMLSEKIKSYDKALEDYDELLELGEKVEGKRDSLLEELGQPTDEENGLTETEPAADTDAAEKAEEKPAESAKEEPAASSERAASSKASAESTASSTGAASGEEVSSGTTSSNAASSETPAESPSVLESASSKDTTGSNEKQGIREAVLKEINEFRAKVGTTPVILDCAYQNELDEMALNLKTTNDSRIDGSTLSDEEMEKISQRDGELKAVLSQIDSYAISYDSGFLMDNPEYTKVSIGVSKGKHGKYNGNYLVVFYH